jgi:hypothetical protein
MQWPRSVLAIGIGVVASSALAFTIAGVGVSRLDNRFTPSVVGNAHVDYAVKGESLHPDLFRSMRLLAVAVAPLVGGALTSVLAPCHRMAHGAVVGLLWPLSAYSGRCTRSNWPWRSGTSLSASWIRAARRTKSLSTVQTTMPPCCTPVA